MKKMRKVRKSWICPKKYLPGAYKTKHIPHIPTRAQIIALFCKIRKSGKFGKVEKSCKKCISEWKSGKFSLFQISRSDAVKTCRIWGLFDVKVLIPWQKCKKCTFSGKVHFLRKKWNFMKLSLFYEKVGFSRKSMLQPSIFPREKSILGAGAEMVIFMKISRFRETENWNFRNF